MYLALGVYDERWFDAENRGPTTVGGESGEYHGFDTPTGIALRGANNSYQVYVGDRMLSFGHYFTGLTGTYLRVRKFNVSISQMLMDDYDAMAQVSNWVVSNSNLIMDCTPSGFGLLPDGQSVIISCPEKNQIYKHIVSENQGADETVFIKDTENIAGDNDPQLNPGSFYYLGANIGDVEGYSEGAGTEATFRYPGSVAVSPDGTWALVAE